MTTSLSDLNRFVAIYNDRDQFKTMQEVAVAAGLSLSRASSLVSEIRHRNNAGEEGLDIIGQRSASRTRIKPDRDPAIQDAMDAFGLETEPNQVWLKNDGYSVQVKSKPEEQAQESYLDKLVAAFSNIPAAPNIPEPKITQDELMTVYPLFDVHLGLLAHAEVSGQDMDLKLGSKRVRDAVSTVMGCAPKSKRGVIINGGDFTHQNDSKNQTPRSGHGLDVAARNIVTIDEAVEVIAACIEMGLAKHELMEYYSVPGNHDPDNWAAILIGLKNRYRGHNRVKICDTFTDFSIIEHGEVAIFIHHGDKRPPKDLAMVCMARYREVFGRTKFCVLMTGHLHHLKADEFPGMYWMQLPAITVPDHHAASGYESNSLMMAITYNRKEESMRNQLKL